MSKSLLEQLPQIVTEGKREAERIMERLESSYRIGLQTRELVIPSHDTNAQDMLLKAERARHDLNPASMNRLIYGDNLLAMAALVAGDDETPSMRGKVDLIYIDPPFDSKADYKSNVHLAIGDIQQMPTALEQFAYADTWSDGTASYLQMLAPRLYLLKELLASHGSIYVHIDWHVGHYAKIVCDSVFGKDNFINEIIWKRSSNTSSIGQIYKRAHDTILFYTDSDDYKFNFQYKELSDASKKLYENHDDHGSYQLVPVLVSGRRNGKTGQVWRGIDPNLRGKAGMHWVTTPDKLDAYYNQGLIVFPEKEGGMPRLKYYIEQNKGVVLSDLWDDISLISSSSKESLNYPTQKPEALLERIISCSSDKGDTVLDIFAGSGTTAAVADRLGRRWIAADLGKPSCMIARKRLIDQDAKPFLYQHVGDYQVEMARSTMGRKFRIGDLAEIVLGLYGALPLPVEENPNRNMGRIPHTKTLVLADSPNKLTGLATLKRAIEIRDNLMGGWDKVVVLGWNFDSSIGHDIQALNQGDRMEVLVIPPDLLDRLKKKGGKLKAEEVRFSSLQYLKIKPVIRKRESGKEALAVEIDNYVLLSPDALNLDEANREKLQKVIHKDPLALIEYWSVDPDYDGEVFRSIWQDYRGNTENDADPYRVIHIARLTGLPAKDGPRRVCVRVVDVFGFEAEAIAEVA